MMKKQFEAAVTATATATVTALCSVAVAVAVTVTVTPAPADSPPPVPATAVGPTSDAEAKLLWKDARADFDAHRDEDAVPKLERLVARYPGKPGFLEAHLLLGISRIRLGLPQQALEPLRHYVDAIGDVVDRAKGKLWIGHARLQLRKYDEALLTSREILTDRKKIGPITEAQALLIQGEARAGLGQDAQAAASVESARLTLKRASAHGLETPAARRPFEQVFGRADALELLLKRRQCAQLASKSPLDEGQVTGQFERRTTCAREASIIALRALQAGDDEAADLAAMETIALMRDLVSAALHPPAPPPLKPRARTRAEAERYLAELSQLLEGSARGTIGDLSERFREERARLPAGSQPRADRIIAEMKQIASQEDRKKQ